MSQEKQLQAVVVFKDGTSARFDDSIPIALQKCLQAGKEVSRTFLSEPLRGYSDVQIARMEAADRKRKKKTKADT